MRHLSGMRSCVGGRWSQVPAGVTTRCQSPDPDTLTWGPLTRGTEGRPQVFLWRQRPWAGRESEARS